MIAIAPDFVPTDVCRNLVALFDRHIPVLGQPDAQAAFAHRVVRLRLLPRDTAIDDQGVRQLLAIRWLATEYMRDTFSNSHVFAEETQIVRWSRGDGQPLHLDLARSTTTYAAIIFLNEDFAGGETFFETGAAIAPRTGTLVAFPGASLRHGVRTVRAGTRMTLPIWFTNLLAAAEP